MYPTFTAKFAEHDIKWEPVEVTTDDGYILTLFHLLGDANGDWKVTRPSVLYIHGMGGDGTEFTSTLGLNDNRPQAYELGSLGFDIWLINNSGTEVS